MPLIQVVVVLAIVGILLYVLFRFVPMDPDIRMIIKVVVIIALILWLFQVFGVWAFLGGVTTPRVR
jgi:hypothetical protein